MLGSRPVPLDTEESSSLAFTRTPARALLKNRGALQENAIYMGSMTGLAKGKTSLLQTPFQPSTHMRKGMQTEKPSIMQHKPLGDKTPFSNRQLPVQTPAPQPSKLGKFSMMDPALAKTPGALLLPSARRKSLRLPRSASKKFTTPAQQGRHWDVSDVELDPDVSTGSADVEEVEQEDYDEIEYMPPKVPEQPYEPLIELPDFTEAGKTILNIAHSYLYDDTTDLYYASDITLQIDMEALLAESGAFTTNSLMLPELESDDDDLILPLVARLESSSQPLKAQKPIVQRRFTREELPTGVSRPLTRAASKALAESRVPTPPVLTQRPSGIATRSRSGSGIAGRATPNSDRSSSRPGMSTSLRTTSSVQPSGRERANTRLADQKDGAGPSTNKTKVATTAGLKETTQLPEDLDIMVDIGAHDDDDFLFDV